LSVYSRFEIVEWIVEDFDLKVEVSEGRSSKTFGCSYLVDLVRVQRPLIRVDLALRQLDHVVDRLTTDLAENRVRVLKFRRRFKSEEELHVVVTTLVVSHRDKSSSSEPKSRVKFILHWFDAIGALRVFSALDDEARDEAMERCLVVEAIEAQLDKVPTCFGSFF
jgi:hypothetical protein